MNRRHFLSASALSLAALSQPQLFGAPAPQITGGLPGLPHFAAKAKRVIYLFQAGGPSQFETLDPKPLLKQHHGKELPASVRGTQRLTGMSGNQATLPVAASFAGAKQHGQSGQWISDLLPHTAKIADDLCIIRSMHSEAINHDPAITFFCSGHQQPGRPAMGAWADFGLGSMNANLPAFVTLVSKDASHDQPLYSRLWGSGFLPSQHQGVQFRAGKEPVLFLDNPDGLNRDIRRDMLDGLGSLNAATAGIYGDPETAARSAQAEMAFRMQLAVPEAADMSKESAATFDLYGASSRQPGTYAANCLLARRLAERGVRFIQLFHQGWDQHGGLPGQITNQCKQTDQASAALVADLKRLGLLEDTLVIWGGEFGRTTYCQGKMTQNDYGRDHHPRCFSLWMAGGGIKGGSSYGQTDEWGYNIVENPVHVHDLHATMLHLMGVDHERLTYRFQGRDYRLTDVAGKVVKAVLA